MWKACVYCFCSLLLMVPCKKSLIDRLFCKQILPYLLSKIFGHFFWPKFTVICSICFSKIDKSNNCENNKMRMKIAGHLRQNSTSSYSITVKVLPFGPNIFYTLELLHKGVSILKMLLVKQNLEENAKVFAGHFLFPHSKCRGLKGHVY